MSPNIRSCNNHSFSGYQSHSVTTSNLSLIPFEDTWYCSSGHFSCVNTSGNTTVTIVTNVSQTTTSKNTSLVPPLNIRSRTHTHSYQGISVSQDFAGYYKVKSLTSCDSGHSACFVGAGLATYSTFTVSTTNITRSLIPEIPVNIKQKIHQHSLPDALLGWYQRYGDYVVSYGYCPSGHGNCVPATVNSTYHLAVGTSSSTTSLD
jgi:hypothetical protein